MGDIHPRREHIPGGNTRGGRSALLGHAAGSVRNQGAAEHWTGKSRHESNRELLRDVLKRSVPARADLENWQRLLLNSDLLVVQERQTESRETVVNRGCPRPVPAVGRAQPTWNKSTASWDRYSMNSPCRRSVPDCRARHKEGHRRHCECLEVECRAVMAVPNPSYTAAVSKTVQFVGEIAR